MLPVVQPDGESTARQILLYSLVLIPISLIPRMLAMTGNLYVIGALALGLYYLYSGTRVTFYRTRRQARAVLLASIVYLPVLYALMLIDHVK
jgi:protoheme IX farnesyltransferase